MENVFASQKLKVDLFITPGKTLSPAPITAPWAETNYLFPVS